MLGIKKRLNLGPLGQKVSLSVLVLVIGIFVSGYMTLQTSAVKPQGLYNTSFWAVPKATATSQGGFYSTETSLEVGQYSNRLNDNYFWGSELNFSGLYSTAYIGFKSNDKLPNSVAKGKVATFYIGSTNIESIAGAGGQCSGSNGTSCSIPFDWKIGTKYSLIVLKSGENTSIGGNKWSGYIRDVVSNQLTLVGTITTPKTTAVNSNWSGLWDKSISRTEYLGSNPSSCTDIPYSSAKFYHTNRWLRSGQSASSQKVDGGGYHQEVFNKMPWSFGVGFNGDKCTNSSISRFVGGFTHEIGTSTIDKARPFVTIASPRSSEALKSKKFWLNAYANDNVGVVKLEVYINNKLVKQENRKDTYFEATIDDTIPSTAHTIKVLAYDAAGNVGSYTHKITYVPPPADLISPTVNITAPINGSVGGNGLVEIKATANDNTAVRKVDFSIDNTLVHTDVSFPYTYRWLPATFANGAHKINVTAYDLSGNKKTATIDVTINYPYSSEEPQISIVTPLTNQNSSIMSSVLENVSGEVNISTVANDAVKKMDFFIDNNLVGTDTSKPFSLKWNSLTVSDAPHILKVIGYNSKGDAKIGSVNLNVNNSPKKIRIVYAAVNFPNGDTSFNNFVKEQIESLSAMDPFIKYRDQISFRSLNLGNVSCPVNTVGVTCDYNEVAQKLAQAGIPYDNVLVVNNGSTARSNATYGSFATINGLDSFVGLHELIHTFGVADEYIKSTWVEAIKSNYDNCFDTRAIDNPYFKNIDIKDMYKGCANSNDYRSSDSSIMGGGAGGSRTLSIASERLLEDELRAYLRLEPLIR